MSSNEDEPTTLREGLYCACGDPSLPPPRELSWLDLIKRVWRHHRWYNHRRIAGYAEAHHLIHLHNHILPDLRLRKKQGKSQDGRPEPKYCIQLLPKGADTAPARERFAADAASRVVVESKLAKKPVPPAEDEWERVLVCRLCKTMARRWKPYDGPPGRVRLAHDVNRMVWHIRSRWVLIVPRVLGLGSCGFRREVLIEHSSFVKHGKMAIEEKDLMFVKGRSPQQLPRHCCEFAS
ncbi:hypothetical protein C8Q74DRAFT_1373572 [Fomes fomentarius]|nr:hypothetical protein C8Q74DRAFT_1373572 [Fomes fomentarius]